MTISSATFFYTYIPKKKSIHVSAEYSILIDIHIFSRWINWIRWSATDQTARNAAQCAQSASAGWIFGENDNNNHFQNASLVAAKIPIDAAIDADTNTTQFLNRNKARTVDM